MSTLQNVRCAIAIIGEKAAGKGEVARILAERLGAFVMRLSDGVRIAHILNANRTPIRLADISERLAQCYRTHGAEAEKAFLDPAFYALHACSVPSTRDLQDIANAVREAEGGGAFIECVLAAADALRMPVVVLDGIRNPGEILSLKKLLPRRNAVLAVVAEYAVREKRFLEKRKRLGDPTTREDFKRLDDRDKGVGENKKGQQVGACLRLAKARDTIENNGTQEDLALKVDAWLAAQPPLRGRLKHAKRQ